MEHLDWQGGFWFSLENTLVYVVFQIALKKQNLIK
jgi:hypothetical protein